MRGPQTQTGKLLRSVLQREFFPSVVRSVHLPRLGEVFSHAATIAVRRRFARAPDLRVVTSYVAESFRREEGEPPSGERARLAEAVIRAYLGELEVGEGLKPHEIGDVALTVLCDLVSVPRATDADINELVLQAERRASRSQGGAGSTGGSRSASGRWLRARRSVAPDPRPPVPGDDTELRPKSLIGQWFRLSFVGDKAARSRLPDDPDETGGLGVIETTFELAMARRFSPEAPIQDVAAFIQGARQRFPDAPIRRLDAELLVRDQLGEAVPVNDIDPRLVVSMRLGLVLAAFDDLGLYDREVDELLVEAEQMVVARGFRPTPAP